VLTGDREQTLSASIEGAFERRGRRLGNGTFAEPSHVRWLTVAGLFADLRYSIDTAPDAPLLDQNQAFSGRVAVNDDMVTWYHDLDTLPRPTDHSDTAQVTGRADELLEVGEGYEERWVRTDRGRVRRAVAELATDLPPGRVATAARIVVVDHLAIAVWCEPRPGGAAFEYTTDWQATELVGFPFAGDLTAAVSALADGARLASGWSVLVAPT
jgi:hypothetical protein